MNRIRKTETDDPKVPTVRYYTYRAVIERYQQAFQDKYYIECISLMESIIADRLESLANQISSSRNFSYKTLEKLLEFLRGKNQHNLLNDELLCCLDEIYSWKDDRNIAIHEMAKLPDDLLELFQTRYCKLEDIAIRGYKLFRDLDNSIRRFRK